MSTSNSQKFLNNKSLERFRAPLMGAHLDRDYNFAPCEWRCLLWLAEYHRHRALDASRLALDPIRQMELTLDGKGELAESQTDRAKFLQVVRYVLDRLFSANGLSCSKKNFEQCPYMKQRGLLMKQGAFAGELLTLLQRAVHLSMLVKYPVDSGLREDEFRDVFGIDLTNFEDLVSSLDDSRLQKLLQYVNGGYQGLIRPESP